MFQNCPFNKKVIPAEKSPNSKQCKFSLLPLETHFQAFYSFLFNTFFKGNDLSPLELESAECSSGALRPARKYHLHVNTL